ncbi:hypothetical protein [Paraburkholderia hospita]|uniref:hypothetical protein n=1 Tax=Paraburkholderia hospita TaxID=169430 RepID=UPI0008A74003|nr:hypothetical protein [Paraburkholderia hospita]SEH89241.1 hypothetical protein SAMN05192544_1011109 [Paraburkholderia hospita]
MSKRYGRNQKRRARERIAALEENGVRLRNAYARRTAENADLTDHVQYVASVLGHMSILSGESLHHTDGDDGMRLHVHNPLSFLPGSLDESEVAMMEIMRLLDVSAVRDMAKRSIHAIVHVGREQSCYAISETTLRSMSREQLAHFLTRKVAPLLCEVMAELMQKKLDHATASRL